MDYDKIIDLSNVEVQNCASLYKLGGMYSVISDGMVVGFEREGMYFEMEGIYGQNS